jgi:hypothetical protein
MADMTNTNYPSRLALIIKKVVNQASKQLPKGLSWVCTDQLLEKTNDLLNEQNLSPNDHNLTLEYKKLMRDLVQDEQVRLIRKYLKKEEKKPQPPSHHPWGHHGAVIRDACAHSNAKALKALLQGQGQGQGGLCPQRPTEDGYADRLLLAANAELAKIALSFYEIEELKALIKKGEPEELKKLSPHHPYKHFPAPWLVKLAKKTMNDKIIKNVLEGKTTSRVRVRGRENGNRNQEVYQKTIDI